MAEASASSAEGGDDGSEMIGSDDDVFNDSEVRGLMGMMMGGGGGDNEMVAV